ncbi:MAG: hypothetical protein GX558_06450 [Clostridiales bacterium]|nr:hypothetical protein [Clostridiales bacterium]
MSMGNADEFLDLYKRLEGEAIDRYGFPKDGTAVSRLERLPEFRDIAQELSYCRDVRNLLQHRYQLDGGFAVQPSDGMVALLRRTLDKIEHPLACRDVATGIDRVFGRRPGDRVLPAMRVMRERGFTYLPVFQDAGRERLYGVFGENAIFSYLIDDNPNIGDDCTFSAMQGYLRLDAQPPFRFAFLSCDAPLREAGALIDQAFAHGKRVGMIFLTRGGRADDPLEGIMTPYDILVRGRR